MRLISHRGAAGLALGNSLESILRADKYSPEYIEVDVSRTKDGVFVMHHGNLHRSYLGASLDETYEELKHEIPSLLTLKELVRTGLDSKLMFDIKSRNHTEDLARVISDSPLKEFAFTSPFIQPLVRLSELFRDSKVFISQPYQEGPFKAIKLARKYGFQGVSLNKWWLGPMPYHGCKQANLELMVYTIDHRLIIRLAGWLFPHILLCTNYPNRFPRKLLKQKNRV